MKWKELDIDYLIDATGVYLTKESASKHKVRYFIMCAPPKDATPQFMVHANENLYNGHTVVSNASCTSNALIPVVKFLHENFKIKDANFNTIHSATASQKTSFGTEIRNSGTLECHPSVHDGWRKIEKHDPHPHLTHHPQFAS